MFSVLKRWLVGKPRDIEDPHLFHAVSLIAFMAWVGLGADGLSSSAYGPHEAFKSLGDQNHYMAVFLALATSLTVFIISFAYSQIIEHFPNGGGGYVVATKLLGSPAGLVSGSALLIDYVLTITVSIASGADAIFAFVPPEHAHWKLPCEFVAIVALVIMNLRGIKESITILIPIFLLFLATHVVLLLTVVFKHAGDIPAKYTELVTQSSASLKSAGLGAMFLIFIKAYSRGAGTFTGIEAVSNGLAIMREPKVETGKRTMVYMAISLALTAGGILLSYYIAGVKVDPNFPDRPLNAVLLKGLVQGSAFFGNWFVILTLVAEALLLLIAAQTGFIDGPRVMANMALDSWLPHRFSSLSERLTTHYGVLLMGLASVAALIYTKGDVVTLVTMYSINVFITFSLTELGMCTFFIRHRKEQKNWVRGLAIQALGLVLCASILILTIWEKLFEGAWVTLAVTTTLIIFCAVIRAYYRKVYSKLGLVTIEPSELNPGLPMTHPKQMDPHKPVAVLLVGNYGGLGVHSFTQIRRMFPVHFNQVIFISVGVIDSGNFKGSSELDGLKHQTQKSLAQYVELAHNFGMAATSMMEMGNEPVEPAAEMCMEIALRYRQAMFFAGKLVFQRESILQHILHNQTAMSIQNRLQWLGYPMLILPIRVWGKGAKIKGDDMTKSTVGLAAPSGGH